MEENERKAKLERLRAIRRGNRGVVTKLEREVIEILGTTPINYDSISRLDVLNQQLEGKLNKLNEIGENVIAICDVEEIENEIAESDAVQLRITELRRKIEATKDISHPTGHVQQQDQQGTASPLPNILPITTTTKLPKLTLPKFRGEITKWNSFWDSFKSAIHNNPSLPAIDKFNYLNSYLEGPALRAVQGLTLTEDNYEAAIEILTDRFGRKQDSIAAHMDELLKLPGCADSERVSNLRLVYDKIRVHTRGLASLGVETEQYGSLLIPVIMAKLPNDIRLRIARESKNSVWQIDELLAVIQHEIEAREISERVKATEVKQQHSYRDMKKTALRSTANALLAGNTTPKTATIQCVYCNAMHFSASCENVSDSNSRRKILAESNRCFNCLKTGHHARECRKTKGCRSCGRLHHQSICMARNREIVSETVQEQSVKETEDFKTKEATTSTKSLTTSAKVNSKRTVLLQTATATAVSPDESKALKVRILFDNGSQRSYVTEAIKERLDLNVTGKETLHLNTFGERGYRKQNCERATVQLKNANNEIVELSALTFPVICSPLSKRVEFKDYPHLDGLELAECSNDQNAIDVLIGSDYYWDLVQGETIRGPTGPVAVNSKFGWLLSGPVNSNRESDVNTSNSCTVLSSPPYLEILNETQEDEINTTLKRFWETESIGIKDSPTTEPSIIDVKQELDIEHNGKLYEVALPWKEDLPTSNNYQMCLSRLKSLRYKLSKNPKLLKDYNDIIQEQEKSGIIERVNNNDKGNVNSIHYLPHQPVIRQNRETTKVRIVYDGSAKSTKEGRSLNDCLENGPNYIPHVFDMLIKFRKKHIALTADIEKAFLMVG